MEELKACRICLETGLQLENLQSTSLGLYYEIITGINLNQNELPKYFCYECAALLKKFYMFRQKSLKGLAVLQGILQTYGKITEDNLQQIDKKSFHLKSNLSVVYVTTLNIIPIDKNISINEDASIENTNDLKNTDVESALDFCDLIKDEPCEKYNSDVEESLDDWLSDDEPLSVHKSKRKSEKKKTAIKEEIKEEAQELFVPKPSIEKKTKVKKINIKIPAKSATILSKGISDDFNFENYVNIITLTEEEQIEEITKRQESENYRSASFKCALCFKIFLDTHTWQHHMKKHDASTGSAQCDVCKLRFKSRRFLNKHIMCHAKKYQCKYCPYVSRHTTQAKNHVLWHQGVMYQCPHCDEMLSQWTSYLSHVRIKHPSDFICPHCGYSFVSQHGLNMHKTLMHRDAADPSETDSKDLPYCSLCDMKFASSEAHKRHMATARKHIQDSENKNGCRECGESFPSKEKLRVHTRSAHANKRVRQYKRNKDNRTWPATCPHCSEEIANARQYWAHFRRNHPDEEYPIEKKYICDICGKSFRGNAFLNYHKRTHTGEKQFKCEECGKTFFNRTNLLMHEKTHSEQRPYVCCVCGKGFKSKGALDRHFRSHTGDKPYKCEVCGKAFAQSNSCKVHVHTVHLKQPSPYISRARLEKRNKSLIMDRPTGPF